MQVKALPTETSETRALSAAHGSKNAWEGR